MGLFDEELPPQVAGAINTLNMGITWIKDQLTAARITIIQNLALILKKPWQALTALVGAVLLSIAMQILYDYLLSIGWIKAIISFLNGMGKLIGSVLNFMQVDTLIALARLGAIFNDKWAAALTSIYDSLGALSEELGRGWSFISAFAEIDRSILYSAYSLSGNAWIESQAAYAKGLTDWMATINSKITAYMKDPNLIFSDLQSSIAAAHVGESDKAVGNILAAIDKVTSWVQDSGETLITMVDEIDAAVKAMPYEIQEAISSYYVPFRAAFDSFVKDQWEPFNEKYEETKGIILDSFNAMDIDIQAIEDKIKSPADWLATILSQNTDEKTESLRKLKEINDAASAESYKNNTDALNASIDAMPVIDITGTPSVEKEPFVPSAFSSIVLPELPPMPISGSWYKGDY
jgi:hypothetical protein